MSGPLDNAAVAPFLAGRLGHPYSWLAECPSTQDVLRGSGAPEGATVVAEYQTAGRGRAGGSWEAEASRAILVSLLLRPDRESDLAQLSLVVGLAVAEAIEVVAGCEASLKWPNDVIVDDRKVAGILLESDADTVVCGIGLNVNQTAHELPTETKLPAGSLALATGSTHDRARLLGEILSTLELRYDSWRAEGLAPLMPELRRRHWLGGRRVATGQGDGIAGTLRADGRLELVLPDATITIGSGAVTPL